MNGIYYMMIIVVLSVVITIGPIMILQRKSKGSPKRCTRKTEGTIVSFGSYDVAAHNINVEYTVDGVKYYCKEKLRTKTEKIGFGLRKTTTLLRGKQVGDMVTIMYNDKNPKDSYIMENYDGKSYVVN